jgi:hypothetical protein
MIKTKEDLEERISFKKLIMMMMMIIKVLNLASLT